MARPRKVTDQMRAYIISLAVDGNPPSVIDRMLPDLGIANIYVTVSKARRAGHPIPHFPSVRPEESLGAARRGVSRCLSINVSGIKHRHRLAAAAELRGLRENMLVQRILAAVINENMIDAVLDDGGQG